VVVAPSRWRTSLRREFLGFRRQLVFGSGDLVDGQGEERGFRSSIGSTLGGFVFFLGRARLIARCLSVPFLFPLEGMANCISVLTFTFYCMFVPSILAWHFLHITHKKRFTIIPFCQSQIINRFHEFMGIKGLSVFLEGGKDFGG
jgi:hypothetical protein